MELDLNKPIFVFYIGVNELGLPTVKKEEFLQEAKKMFGIYNNITSWFVASNENRIECIYDGKNKNRNKELNRLITEINERIQIFSESKDLNDFKINLTDWKIDELINNK